MGRLEEMRRVLLSGEIYDPMDEELFTFQLTRIEAVNAYNKIPATPSGLKEREKTLRALFASCGEGCYIEPPFHANLGGWNVHFGKNVYANFNLTLVDDGKIEVGEHTLIGSNVQLITACHPVSPDLRRKGLQYNLPVKIGKNVWLGAGVTVLPGVSIGDDTIVGAGSLVTKDLPSGVVAVGSPARVLRPITEEDRKYYNHGVPIPDTFL